MADDAFARAAQARKESPFLCPKGAAFFLKVSVRYLEQLRARGDGPEFRRHCRRIIYHIDDLERWSKSTSGTGKAA